MNSNIIQTTDALMATLSRTFSARSVHALANMAQADEETVSEILSAMQDLPCFIVEATNGGRIRKVKLNVAAVGYAGEERNARTGNITFYKNGVAVHMMNDRVHTKGQIEDFRRELSLQASNENLTYVDPRHTGSLVEPLVRERMKSHSMTRTKAMVH